LPSVDLRFVNTTLSLPPIDLSKSAASIPNPNAKTGSAGGNVSVRPKKGHGRQKSIGGKDKVVLTKRRLKLLILMPVSRQAVAEIPGSKTLLFRSRHLQFFLMQLVDAVPVER
jgi:hypothetical protein